MIRLLCPCLPCPSIEELEPLVEKSQKAGTSCEEWVMVSPPNDIETGLKRE